LRPRPARNRFLFPFPFVLWHAIGYLSEFLPPPPITRNQVELMQIDNVAEADVPGFDALRILPQAMEEVLREIMKAQTRTAIAKSSWGDHSDA